MTSPTHINVTRHSIFEFFNHSENLSVRVSVGCFVDEREVGLSHACKEDGGGCPVTNRDKHEDEREEREEEDRHHVLESSAT